MLRHHLSILTVEWHLNDQIFRYDVTLLTFHQKHNVFHSFNQSTWNFWNIWKFSVQKENRPCGCGIHMTYFLFGTMMLKISRVFCSILTMRAYIKFNMEMKYSVSNPILDVLVTRKGASFVTTVYRKSTLYWMLSSLWIYNHPFNVKRGVIQSWVYRANTLCQRKQDNVAEP
jgi:hypothetical protein